MKIKNREMETACLTELDVTVKGEVIAKMRLYWSANAGAYGYQIGALCWDWRDENNTSPMSEFITGGCGYCKESHAFALFLTDLDLRAGGGEVGYYFNGTKYHLGGNYYRVPLSVLKRKFKKGKR